MELEANEVSFSRTQICKKNEIEKKNFLCQFVAPSLNLQFPTKNKEIIFVVDGSGSMRGSP